MWFKFMFISPDVFYLPATENPLSADVGIVSGRTHFWIFDVGSSDAHFEFLKHISEEKPLNIIISHFHPDHIRNLSRLKFDNLFVGPYTYKHINAGTVIETPAEFFDDVKIRIIPLPNSHSKGSLVLEVNDEYTFLGDSTYCTEKNDRKVFNAQLLQQEISVLTSLKSKYFLVSHWRKIVQSKERILRRLNLVYSIEHKDSPWIDFGSVKKRF